MKTAMRRLQRLEKKRRQDRRVIFRFHLNDGRVVDSDMNEIPETSKSAKNCIFIDFCEADLYL
jgi:hypothetical protein